jgi:hypothetical protein
VSAQPPGWPEYDSLKEPVTERDALNSIVLLTAVL